MYNEFQDNSVGTLAECSKQNRTPSARDQLTRRKADLEELLADTNAAIQALDEHPDVEKVLTLVGRTVRF